MKQQRKVRSVPSRSGMLLIIAMICLTLSTALLGALLEYVVVGRRAAKNEAAQLQADWLAESAIDRAVAKLSRDPNYLGETWTIPAEDWSQRDSGRVQITIEKTKSTQDLEVQVSAVYPFGKTPAVTRTKSIIVTVPNIKPQKSREPASAEKP